MIAARLIIFGALVIFPPATCKTEIESSFTECGRTTPRLVPMVVGGTTAMRGELPWHVGVYRRTSNPYKLICGGSIVSRNVVLSAAHCFWDLQNNVMYPASNFAAAAGKIYRPWMVREPSAQYSFIEELVIPESFRGEDRNFADDIAMAVLSHPFEFKPYLRPVCLDFNRTLEDAQLWNGNMGKIAGWGLVTDSGKESSLLRTTELPYKDINICLKSTPSSYWEVLTNEKFCAGYTNGSTALCKGDSGGGLVFPSTDSSGVTRYYLRGIVSSSPSSIYVCNSFAVTTFTKVSRYGAFIRQRVAGTPPPQAPISTRRCVLPPYPENGHYRPLGAPSAVPGDRLLAAILTVSCSRGYRIVGEASLYCIDGNWQDSMPTCAEETTECGRLAPELQLLIVNATTAHGGKIPWHAGIYTTSIISGSSNPTQICGGTIISKKHVVTAAHCVWDTAAEELKPASGFMVAAGKIYRKWDYPEREAQFSNVSEISLPPRFLGVLANFAQDIAILTLTKSLEYTPYLRPICLDFDKSFESLQLHTGNKGTIAGWGLTDVKSGKPSNVLKAAQFSYKDFKTCLKETPKDFITYYTSDKICAGTNGTALCKGDSGGGLAFPYIDSKGVEKYYLRGVASTGPLGKDDEFCRVEDTNTYYTKVSPFEDLFRTHLDSIKYPREDTGGTGR